MQIDWWLTVGLIWLGIGILTLLAVTWRGVMMPSHNQGQTTIWECMLIVSLIVFVWPMALHSEAHGERMG